ncbi:hypothetical protein BC332_34805 [Capsicum chinense]|nr:hypothetical protein BC332_34805 [Capsicum chinense]
MRDSPPSNERARSAHRYRTIIDDQNEWKKGAIQVLLAAQRRSPDVIRRVVIWSHGSPLHVEENVSRIRKHGVKIDAVLSNMNGTKPSPKNLLHIYNVLPDAYYDKAVLIDDTVPNFTPEYTDFLIPEITKTDECGLRITTGSGNIEAALRLL